MLAPGDFAVYETDRAFRWALQEDWELLVLTWPRAAVRLPAAASQALTAVRLHDRRLVQVRCPQAQKPGLIPAPVPAPAPGLAQTTPDKRL